ncbi:MAG: hypothetical protein QNJ97_19655 [Myxococcota bacterium]|nr:hypothetical protein [Myxococcota bacterium]
MMRLAVLASSRIFLTAASLITISCMFAYIFPASTHITERSVSITENFYIIGGFMILLMVSCACQALLVVRLVWGVGAIVARPATAKADGDDLDEPDMRAMRVTGTKKAIVFTFIIVVNTFIFDYLGNGIVATDTRAHRILTLLRSQRGQDRADAVHDAILLTGDDRIQAALGRVLSEPGEARDWAAYAAGVRHDIGLTDQILRLFQTGTPRERAAAAVALARMKDYRLVRHVAEAFPTMGPLQGDLFAALGMLGKTKDTSEADLKTAGAFLAEQLTTGGLDKPLRRLVIWALGQFEAPEGLLPLERLLEKPGDTGTLCVDLEALGKIGSASTSPKLIALIYTLDRTLSCPELVYTDATGHQVLLSTGINIIERLLHEVAHIGDRRARPEMEKLAKDGSFSKNVRHLAGEIAFQMKYKPVGT